VNWIDGLITFVGRQDNLALREAALFAFAENLLMVIAALIAIVVLIPRNRPLNRRLPSRRQPRALVRVLVRDWASPRDSTGSRALRVPVIRIR